MLRLIRFSVIAIVLLAGFMLWTQSAAAVSCYFYSADVDYVCDSEPQTSNFVEPQPFPDSFIERATYARLKDLINVYPEPTTAVAPVRNVGDGFLFVTVQAVENHDGVNWYMINLGEWVKEEDLILVDDSEFTGYAINSQPERPFGWMIVDYWYSTEPGAEPAPGSLKLPRYTFLKYLMLSKQMMAGFGMILETAVGYAKPMSVSLIRHRARLKWVLTNIGLRSISTSKPLLPMRATAWFMPGWFLAGLTVGRLGKDFSRFGIAN